MKLKITLLDIKPIKIHCDMPIPENEEIRNTPAFEIEEKLQVSLIGFRTNDTHDIIDTRFHTNYQSYVKNTATPHTVAQFDLEHAAFLKIDMDEKSELEELMKNPIFLNSLLKSTEYSLHMKVASLLEQLNIPSSLFKQPIEAEI